MKPGKITSLKPLQLSPPLQLNQSRDLMRCLKKKRCSLVIYLQYPDEKRLEGLSKQLDWDVRKIQCWFRHRRNQDKPPTLTKFCESMQVCRGRWGVRRRMKCEWTEVFFLEMTCIIKTIVDECAGLTNYIYYRQERRAWGDQSPFLGRACH